MLYSAVHAAAAVAVSRVQSLLQTLYHYCCIEQVYTSERQLVVSEL
jgi:hypothetical protein